MKETHMHFSDEKKDVERVVYVVYHELCHFIAGIGYKSKGHGKKWKELMRVFGAPDTAKISDDEEFGEEFTDFAKEILAKLPDYDFEDYTPQPKLIKEKPKIVANKTFYKQLDLVEWVNNFSLDEENIVVSVSVKTNLKQGEISFFDKNIKTENEIKVVIEGGMENENRS